MPQSTASTARELARTSADCSFLLTHLIRQNDGRSEAQALSILQSILNLDGINPAPMLRASKVGWYSHSTPYVFNPETHEFDGIVNNLAVCFTESTFAGLRAHRDHFSALYGLAFDRTLLQQHGANPCINLSEQYLRRVQRKKDDPYDRYAYNFIPSHLQPFVNIMHETYDSTHEREWRYPGDLNFNYHSIRYVFCPERDFHLFSRIQTNSMPCLFDLAWLDQI